MTDSHTHKLQAADRLSALNQTALLDTPAEAVFDRAVELATYVLGTPVGLVSLVDDRRQFFKAQVGLPEPVASRRETPLSHSFCQYVVTSDEPLIVNDAREDMFLRDNLAIPDLSVIAYLGVPVHDPDGNVLGSFCAIDDKPRDWTRQDKEILENILTGVESEIALRAELRKRIAAEKLSADTEQRLHLALQAGRLGTFDFDPQSGIASWDQMMYDLWWIDPEESNPFPTAQARVHPDDRTDDRAAREASLDPTGDGKHKAELRIVHPETGEIRWLHLDGQTSFEDGEPVRVVGTARDITERRNAEERSSLLTQELNHRVKNLFAITSGMITLTARSAKTPEDMGRSLSGRVQALAIAHDLVQPAIVGNPDQAEPTTLEKLLESVLKPHAGFGESFRLAGPKVRLESRSASGLALVFHELATNAFKYGASSVPSGRIEVSWKTDTSESGSLDLLWREINAPVRKCPTQSGFGSRLIEETITGQLLGKLSRSWDDGLSCEIEVPLSVLQK